MRKLTMAILCSTALALGACGSAGKAGAPSNALSIEQTTQIDSADGIDASKLLFSSSTSVVIAGGSVGQKWEGAKEAVKRGAPLLVRTADNASAIDAEIKRLGLKTLSRSTSPRPRIQKFLKPTSSTKSRSSRPNHRFSTAARPSWSPGTPRPLT